MTGTTPDYKLSFQNNAGSEVANITNTGNLTLAGLTTDGAVYVVGGTLNSESYLNVSRGGTGVNGSSAWAGSILIGNGLGFSIGNLVGTVNQINVASSAGEITLSLPQDIALTSNPTFAGMNLTNTSNQIMLGNNNLTNHTTTISATGSASDMIASLPQLTGSDTFVFENQAQTINNKTIGTAGLVFSGASVDILTVSDEDFTITPGGTGQIVLSSNVQLGSSPVPGPLLLPFVEIMQRHIRLLPVLPMQQE